jgi:hypothetical protein
MGTYGSTWTARGYAGQGQVEPLIDSLHGRTALVCGNGAGVFDQVEMACSCLDDPVIFAVNDAGMYLPRVDHWVSLHVDKLLAWRQVRWQEARPGETLKCHSDTSRPWLDYHWQQLTPQFCLSGYYAMQLAWVMGCNQIVLCGCPGQSGPRWFEQYARTDFGYGSDPRGSDEGVRTQIVKEMARLPAFKAAVRSVSGGFTQSFFGGL